MVRARGRSERKALLDALDLGELEAAEGDSAVSGMVSYVDDAGSPKRAWRLTMWWYQARVQSTNCHFKSCKGTAMISSRRRGSTQHVMNPHQDRGQGHPEGQDEALKALFA